MHSTIKTINAMIYQVTNLHLLSTKQLNQLHWKAMYNSKAITVILTRCTEKLTAYGLSVCSKIPMRWRCQASVRLLQTDQLVDFLEPYLYVIFDCLDGSMVHTNPLDTQSIFCRPNVAIQINSITHTTAHTYLIQHSKSWKSTKWPINKHSKY